MRPSHTMVVVVVDSGSYFSTVRLCFDPRRGKGTHCQTGIWAPLIAAVPPVNPATVGRKVRHMVNAAVDVFLLFSEVAGIDVHQGVLRSLALDARPQLPYRTTPGQESIWTANYTQTGTNLAMNFDGSTDSADLALIQAKFGRRCGMRTFVL